MGIQMKINYISENNMFFYLKYINFIQVPPFCFTSRIKIHHKFVSTWTGEHLRLMLVVLVVMGRLHLPGPEHDVLGLNTGPVVAGYLKGSNQGWS